MKAKIGLEIHLELNTKSKMFCSCKNSPDDEPNTHICPICLAHPGTLPSPNKEAIKKVIKVGKALGSKIREKVFFERKNYFYPDLPKGYQISQYRLPLCEGGELEIKTSFGKKSIRIRRVHIEEDTAKIYHLGEYVLLDFNRAGVPLMELVTEPNMETPEEAEAFCKRLKELFLYLEVSEAEMEKGKLRLEANVSVEGGERVEIKNLNSFKALREAISFEIERQKELLKKGEKIFQQTRGWDEKKKETVLQREKETAKDYRYFFEPDLPPFDLKKEKIIEEIFLPELPWEKEKRFKKEFPFLEDKKIEILVSKKEVSYFFESAVSEVKNWMKFEKIPQAQEKRIISSLCDFLLVYLLGTLKKEGIPFEKMKLTPENFAETLIMLWEGKISPHVAKELLSEMIKKGGDPSEMVKEKGLSLISEKETIEKIALEVINEQKKAVEDYKKGKKSALNFLLGKMMQKTKGKISPHEAKKILEKILSEN